MAPGANHCAGHSDPGIPSHLSIGTLCTVRSLSILVREFTQSPLYVYNVCVREALRPQDDITRHREIPHREVLSWPTQPPCRPPSRPQQITRLEANYIMVFSPIRVQIYANHNPRKGNPYQTMPDVYHPRHVPHPPCPHPPSPLPDSAPTWAAPLMHADKLPVSERHRDRRVRALPGVDHRRNCRSGGSGSDGKKTAALRGSDLRSPGHGFHS